MSFRRIVRRERFSVTRTAMATVERAAIVSNFSTRLLAFRRSTLFERTFNLGSRFRSEVGELDVRRICHHIGLADRLHRDGD